MAISKQDTQFVLGDQAARQLANVTKTAPQLVFHFTALADPFTAMDSGRGRHLPP